MSASFLWTLVELTASFIWLSTCGMCIGAYVLCRCLCVSFWKCFSKRQERPEDPELPESSPPVEEMQRQINAMSMETMAMRQCIKKVIVENQINLDEESQHLLKLPNVTIEYAPASTPIMYTSTGALPQTYYLLPPDNRWEFPSEKLILGQVLGEGEFGKVVLGEVKGILPGCPKTIVAVKMLKNNSSDSDMIDLVSEMEILKSIGTHENVLRLLGCCTQDGNLLIITEFACRGNLRSFLKKHLRCGNETNPLKNLSMKNLLTFASQIAEGMNYLASRKCIHRDLAARNILVTENYTMKIGDFGLARDIENKNYYKKRTDGRLPVKWMAPEALYYSIYTVQSDVWSYGILLWEIMTFGGTPYVSIMDLGNLYQILQSGYRMEKPPNCSNEAYGLMRHCWSFMPEHRPSFLEISQNLWNLLSMDETSTYDIQQRNNMNRLNTPESNNEEN